MQAMIAAMVALVQVTVPLPKCSGPQQAASFMAHTHRNMASCIGRLLSELKSMRYSSSLEMMAWGVQGTSVWWLIRNSILLKSCLANHGK